MPSYEALWIISRLVKESALTGGGGGGGGGADTGGVIDMASGNGYWTYMLRRMQLPVTAVDNMASEYRTAWISDTIESDGVEYLNKNNGGKGKVLLMVYMVTKGNFTKRVLNAYKGDTIVVVGTMNENRFTGFEDCTVEEYFEREMGGKGEGEGWELIVRIPVPSFAGKDEGMFVWKRKSKS